ncbi:hypothetical protein SLS56_002269 [Neofusicoccum ribis]|uniref:Uncharacterized protein n=1 Tax=Neofusicoccum ribis TaxID=45134 RepID=A0ABR3T5Z4_9PEZI
MADPLHQTSAGKKRKSRGSQGQINLIGRLDETLQESAEHQAVIIELRKQHEEGGKISAGGIEALKHLNYILSHTTKDTITDLSGHVKSSTLLSAHHEMKELILARILEIELDVQHLEKTIDMVIAGHY